MADFVTRDKLEIWRLLKQVWNPKQANSKGKLSIPTSSSKLFSLSYTNCSVNGKNVFQVLTLKKQKEFSPLPSFASRLPSPGPSLGPALSSHAQSGKCTWEWGRDLASRSETQHWKYTAVSCVLWPWAGQVLGQDGEDNSDSQQNSSLGDVAVPPTLNRLSYLVTVSAKSIFSRLPTNWRSSGCSSMPM